MQAFRVGRKRGTLRAGSEVEGDVAAHEEAGGAGDEDAVAREADPEGAAAAGDLPCGHLRPPEPAGPERSQVCMGAAGHRVLRNVQFGIEAARNEIVPAHPLGGRGR